MAQQQIIDEIAIWEFERRRVLGFNKVKKRLKIAPALTKAFGQDVAPYPCIAAYSVCTGEPLCMPSSG